MRVLLFSLLLSVSLTGGLLESSQVRPVENCGSDVLHPLTLEVVPLQPVRSGATVTARITFDSRIPLDDVVTRIEAPRDVALLSAPSTAWGRMKAGESRQEEFTVVVPRGGPRQTVQVTVEGMHDGFAIRRGAVLNLAVETEPSRLVTRADGRKIREVRARKLP